MWTRKDGESAGLYAKTTVPNLFIKSMSDEDDRGLQLLSSAAGEDSGLDGEAGGPASRVKRRRFSSPREVTSHRDNPLPAANGIHMLAAAGDRSQVSVSSGSRHGCKLKQRLPKAGQEAQQDPVSRALETQAVSSQAPQRRKGKGFNTIAGVTAALSNGQAPVVTVAAQQHLPEAPAARGNDAARDAPPGVGISTRAHQARASKRKDSPIPDTTAEQSSLLPPTNAANADAPSDTSLGGSISARARRGRAPKRKLGPSISTLSSLPMAPDHHADQAVAAAAAMEQSAAATIIEADGEHPASASASMKLQDKPAPAKAHVGRGSKQKHQERHPVPRDEPLESSQHIASASEHGAARPDTSNGRQPELPQAEQQPPGRTVKNPSLPALHPTHAFTSRTRGSRAAEHVQAGGHLAGKPQAARPQGMPAAAAAEAAAEIENQPRMSRAGSGRGFRARQDARSSAEPQTPHGEPIPAGDGQQRAPPHSRARSTRAKHNVQSASEQQPPGDELPAGTAPRPKHLRQSRGSEGKQTAPLSPGHRPPRGVSPADVSTQQPVTRRASRRRAPKQNHEDEPSADTKLPAAGKVKRQPRTTQARRPRGSKHKPSEIISPSSLSEDVSLSDTDSDDGWDLAKTQTEVAIPLSPPRAMSPAAEASGRLPVDRNPKRRGNAEKLPATASPAVLATAAAAGPVHPLQKKHRASAPADASMANAAGPPDEPIADAALVSALAGREGLRPGAFPPADEVLANALPVASEERPDPTQEQPDAVIAAHEPIADASFPASAAGRTGSILRRHGNDSSDGPSEGGPPSAAAPQTGDMVGAAAPKASPHDTRAVPHVDPLRDSSSPAPQAEEFLQFSDLPSDVPSQAKDSIPVAELDPEPSWIPGEEDPAEADSGSPGSDWIPSVFGSPPSKQDVPPQKGLRSGPAHDEARPSQLARMAAAVFPSGTSPEEHEATLLDVPGEGGPLDAHGMVRQVLARTHSLD